MSVGSVETPMAWNPAPEAISILEQPLLKPEAAGPNCNCFWMLESFEAPIRAEVEHVPNLRAGAGVDRQVKLVTGAVGTFPGERAARIVHIAPFDEPTTSQLVPS